MSIIIHAINTRFVEHHGFTSSQLFIDFNSRYAVMKRSFRDVHALMSIFYEREDRYDKSTQIQKKEYAVQIKKNELYHRREQALEKMVKHNKQLQERNERLTKYNKSKLEDLVLLKNHSLENVRGRKLDSRIRNSVYRIVRISDREQSVHLVDVTTSINVGKFNMNHVKLFMQRKEQIFDKESLDRRERT